MLFEPYFEKISSYVSVKFSPKDKLVIQAAFEIAKEAHETQKRDSGEPYFSHPIAVSEIVAKLGFDTASIAAALLHDTIEDTSLKLCDIETYLNKDIADLVEGLTKLNKLEFKNNTSSYKNENFRKFIFALSKDLRVVVVKLADRLHNMKTLNQIQSEERRVRIATETIDVYVPIARMIGLSSLQRELEDLAFAEIEPKARESIIARMNYLIDKDEGIIGRIEGKLSDLMSLHHIQCTLQNRLKTPFSIWQKMKTTGSSFEQLSDVMAFRIITKDVKTCYEVLGVIHTYYSVIFDRFKDYISIPKRNNYRSLHTTIIGPENKKIEVQIRTEDMHKEAEFGIAAHSFYKDGKIIARKGERGDVVFLNWINGIKEILENSQYPEDVVKYTKMEMFSHNIFAFTPGGNIIRLPQNATALDFAFAVHTELGLNTISVKINGEDRALNYKVKNGDQIEVITSKDLQARFEWDEIVVTGRAKSTIRRALKMEKRKDEIEIGRDLFREKCIELNIVPTETLIKNILYHTAFKDVNEMYYQIGKGQLTPSQIIFSKINKHNEIRTLEFRLKNTGSYYVSDLIFTYEQNNMNVESFKVIERNEEFIKVQVSVRE
jgi:GTP pyrophosphokinase